MGSVPIKGMIEDRAAIATATDRRGDGTPRSSTAQFCWNIDTMMTASRQTRQTVWQILATSYSHPKTFDATEFVLEMTVHRSQENSGPK